MPTVYDHDVRIERLSMTMDPLAILKEIAKQFGKRIGRANLFDANVCTSPLNPERPWEYLALPGDFFRHKLTIKLSVHKIELLANGEFISVQVAGNLVDADLCSINRRDKVFQLVRNLLVEPSFLFPVYSRRADTDLRQFLSSAALSQALNRLQLTEDESLHICNEIVLYLKRNSKNDVMLAIEAACQLAEHLVKNVEKEQLDRTASKIRELVWPHTKMGDLGRRNARRDAFGNIARCLAILCGCRTPLSSRDRRIARFIW